jgi:hypothetical protein
VCGKKDLHPASLTGEPFYILDNGLNPRIADLLSQLEYSMRSVQAEFGVAPTDSLSDEEIIRHIGNTYGHRGVWVTKDTSSKREHAETIRASGISVIWIKQQTLSSRQQHHVVTLCYHRTYQELTDSRSPIHYEATFHGQPGKERLTCRPLR